MKNVTYTMQGDYRLPDLLPTQEAELHLGKYALLRRRYLKEHRRVTYTNLLTSGKLNEHLLEIDQTVKARLTEIIPHMMESEGVTEEMKAVDQMKWVNMMNNIRASAEEIVLKELVFKRDFLSIAANSESIDFVFKNAYVDINRVFK